MPDRRPPTEPPWAVHQPEPIPGQGWGRQLWIGWCILWAIFWLTIGWLFAPILNLPLAVLSLFAIAIGQTRTVRVLPPPPPTTTYRQLPGPADR